MLLMDIDKAHVRDDIDEAKEVLGYLSKSKQEPGPFPDHVPSHRARTPNSWSPAKKLAGEEPFENPVPQTHFNQSANAARSTCLTLTWYMGVHPLLDPRVVLSSTRR